ncbi:MAG TPA: Crp/Fnr family transcriptional regulator [Terriglobia bacterium]|nr:Crp/Fnr family transcriptional regulator [Terriglobia bacterium]
MPVEEYRRLVAHGENVQLPVGTVLYEPNQPIRNVYFMLDGIASIVTVMKDGDSIEVLIIGREGMVGLAALESASQTVPNLAFMQIAGHGIKFAAAIIRDEFKLGGSLQLQLLRYFQFGFVQMSQNAACNRLHGLEERMGRWLLMVQDRLNSSSFQITHEFLAQMLGTRRSSVTLAAGVLQRAGLIRYHRGEMQILDREELQNAACECYATIKDAWDLFMERPETVRTAH